MTLIRNLLFDQAKSNEIRRDYMHKIKCSMPNRTIAYKIEKKNKRKNGLCLFIGMVEFRVVEYIRMR